MQHEFSPESFSQLIRTTPSVAFDYLTEEVMAYGFYSRIRKLLTQVKIDLAIDAGAHTGQFGGILCGYIEWRGRLISFEPVTKFFDLLSTNSAFYKDWIVEHKALSNKNRKRNKIFIGNGHGGTSSLLPQTDNLAQFASTVQLDAYEFVESVRLDTYLSNINVTNESILLKLDVQGFEKNVLKSVGKFKSNIKLILAELSSVPFYKGQDTLSTMIKFLDKMGYVPILFHNNFGHGSLIHFDYDVLFCKTNDLHELTKVISIT